MRPVILVASLTKLAKLRARLLSIPISASITIADDVTLGGSARPCVRLVSRAGACWSSELVPELNVLIPDIPTNIPLAVERAPYSSHVKRQYVFRMRQFGRLLIRSKLETSPSGSGLAATLLPRTCLSLGLTKGKRLDAGGSI